MFGKYQRVRHICPEMEKSVFLETWKLNWGSANATNHCGTFIYISHKGPYHYVSFYHSEEHCSTHGIGFSIPELANSPYGGATAPIVTNGSPSRGAASIPMAGAHRNLHGGEYPPMPPPTPRYSYRQIAGPGCCCPYARKLACWCAECGGSPQA